MADKTLVTVAYFATSSSLALIFWLMLKFLFKKLDPKTFFIASGFGIYMLNQILYLVTLFFPNLNITSNLLIWTESIALWLILIAFAFDSHTRLRLLTILGLVSLFLFQDHGLLTVQALIISMIMASLMVYKKHDDMIPLFLGFLFIAVGHFFVNIQEFNIFGDMSNASAFMFIFGSFLFFYWSFKTIFQEKIIKNHLEFFI